MSITLTRTPLAEAEASRHNMTRNGLPVVGVTVHVQDPTSLRKGMRKYVSADVLTTVRNVFGANVFVATDGDTTLVWANAETQHALGYAYPQTVNG